jgi:hypothetical protein
MQSYFLANADVALRCASSESSEMMTSKGCTLWHRNDFSVRSRLVGRLRVTRAMLSWIRGIPIRLVAKKVDKPMLCELFNHVGGVIERPDPSVDICLQIDGIAMQAQH